MEHRGLPEILPHHFEVLESAHTADICLQAALAMLDCGDLAKCKSCVEEACEVVTQIPDRMGYQDTYAFFVRLDIIVHQGLTTELAQAVGVSLATVYAWASGEDTPTTQQLGLFAEFAEAHGFDG